MISLTSTKNIGNKELLSGSTLKLIALISMLIDHAAVAILYYGLLYPNRPISVGSRLYQLYLLYQIMRKIGRIAFPIFCFLLVEGFLYTSNRKKYALRLFLFCLISEIPFDLALRQSFFEFTHQNVFFTLFIGFIVLWGLEYFQNKPYLQALTVAAGMGLAWLLKTDYDYKGIVLIVVLYLFHLTPALMTLSGCVSLLWEAPAMLAFIPINLYNHKRGFSAKYFFYLFYPGHLFILWLIRKYLLL